MSRIFFTLIDGFILTIFINLVINCDIAKAADVEVTKSIPEPITDFAKNMRGSVEIRNYADLFMTDDELQKLKPMYQARGILGTKLFSKRFDSQITFKANKYEGTTIVEQGQSEWENYLSALDFDYAEITPYVIFYLPYKGSDTLGEVGLYTAGKLPFATTVGNFKFTVSAEGKALQHSRPETARVEKRDPDMALNLKGENKDEIEKKDASFVSEYSGDLLFMPAVLKKFNLLAKVYFTKEFDPRYEAVEINGEIETEKTGYSVKNSTTTRIMATYNITEKLAVINDFYQFSEGFYESRRDSDGVYEPRHDAVKGPRITNIFKFTYTLF